MKNTRIFRSTSPLLAIALLAPPIVSAFTFITNTHHAPLSISTQLDAAKKSPPPPPQSSSDPAKKAALDGVLSQIERSYGRGSIVKLGETSDSFRTNAISSGSLLLDTALGGGYPAGRIIEIYGPESSGKTTLALHAIASSQAEGGICAFVDAEHALDPTYASNLGVDVENLYVSQPDSGEMALDIVDRLVRSAAVSVVVVDSVAALVPRAELEGDMGDQQMGLQARLMSKAMRKITGSLNLGGTTVIFLNQLRSKVGVIFGSPEVTAGGNALKFYASIRIDTRRKEILADNSGIRIKVKVVKNKVAPPFKIAMLDILFGSGIDQFSSLLDAAEESEIIVRKGSWYSYRETNFAQGRAGVVAYFKEHPEFKDEVEHRVRHFLMTGETAEEEDDTDSDKEDNITELEKAIGRGEESVME